MAEWTHLMCADCWNSRHHGDERKAVEGANSEPEPCCFCGKETTSGLYIRHDGRELECVHDGLTPSEEK